MLTYCICDEPARLARALTMGDILDVDEQIVATYTAMRMLLIDLKFSETAEQIIEVTGGAAVLLGGVDINEGHVWVHV